MRVRRDGPTSAAGACTVRRFDPVVVWTLAAKEARDALRNRWFLFYAACFACVSLTVSHVALAGAGSYGLAGFGRTAAGVINLVLLLIPLMGLTIGAGSLAGERERGTLETLLTQPIGRAEVLLGKYAGAAMAMLGALCLGFGAAAVLMAARGGAVGAAAFASTFALSALLAGGMLSVGFLISALARRTAVATAAALLVWLGLVFLSDLGLMGGALVLRWEADQLLILALANPVHVFKIAAVGQLHTSLDLLGPAGLYAHRALGDALPHLLVALLAAWWAVPLLLACVVFQRRSLR